MFVTNTRLPHWSRFVRSLGLLLPAVVFIASASPHRAKAQQQVFVPPNDVSFTIRCERKTYKLGEQVSFTYKVKNISRAAIFVPRGVWEVKCPSSPHVWAWFEDGSGRHFIPGYAGSCLGQNAIKISERMKKDAVLLRPGEVYEGSSTLDTRTFADVLKPGSYRVEAGFYGWRDDQFTEAERAELASMKHAFLRGEQAASCVITLAP
jgi:hypothetical protein